MQYALVVGLVAVATVSTHADVYRMTMFGTLDQVVDNRTSANDPFDGTAFDIDDFTASVGDVWSYEVIFDTDVQPDEYKAGDRSLYYERFSSSVSIAGRTVAAEGGSSLLFYLNDNNSDELQQVMELGGSIDQDQRASVYAGLIEYDMVDALINNGDVIDSESALSGVDDWYFEVLGDQGAFYLRSAGGPLVVTVEQIPSPSGLSLLGFGGLFAARRRR